MKLTDLSVQRLKPPTDKQIVYYDDGLPNFGIRIGKRSKTFIVKLGRSRAIKSVGRYPQISLKTARDKAKRLLATYNGRQASQSYSEAVESFLEDSGTRNREKTVEEYKRYLEAFSTSKQVNEITRADMQQELDRHKTPATRKHALVTFKVFFNWCLRQELTERNPVQGERAPKLPTRERVLTDEEIKEVYNYEHPPFSTIVKLCLLTGQRRSEVAKIHSDWIEGETLTIPASVAKNGRTHTIPIASLASEILKGEGLLFGNDKGTTFSGWSKGKRQMDAVVQIPHWTLHDLRRTFASVMASLGVDIHIIERFLNHATGTISGVTAIYNRHHYSDQMRAAILVYETHIKTLVDSKTPGN